VATLLVLRGRINADCEYDLWTLSLFVSPFRCLFYPRLYLLFDVVTRLCLANIYLRFFRPPIRVIFFPMSDLHRDLFLGFLLVRPFLAEASFPFWIILCVNCFGLYGIILSHGRRYIGARGVN